MRVESGMLDAVLGTMTRARACLLCEDSLRTKMMALIYFGLLTSVDILEGIELYSQTESSIRQRLMLVLAAFGYFPQIATDPYVPHSCI